MATADSPSAPRCHFHTIRTHIQGPNPVVGFLDNGKPVVRPGRKAMGLAAARDRQAAERFLTTGGCRMSWTRRARRLSSRWGDAAPLRERIAGIVLTWMALVNLAGVVKAQDQTPVMRVEEDWELVVAEPDLETTAPQVTCVVSPTDGLDGYYASIELNHQTQPDFSSGGVHLQTWAGEEPLDTEGSTEQGLLSLESETVRWTQSMQLVGSALKFAVEGDSATWGHFGGGGELRATVGTTLSSLNDYRPDTSVAHSGVGLASNRVTRLVLKEVRYYSAQGLLLRDTTERVVYPK